MKFKLTIAFRLMCIGLFNFTHSFAQQHFSYRPYMDILGPINPTWYLSDRSNSINTVVRNQWVGIEGAPTTLVLNGHIPFNSINSATGINLSYNSLGPMKLWNISTFFAKAVRLSDRGEYLSASLSLGVSRFEALYSSLDPHDPSFKQDDLGTTGTLGVGVMFYKPEKYFVGISMPQLSMQKLGKASKQEYKFSTPYFAMIGYLAKIDDIFKIKPVILSAFIKGLPINYDFSTSLYLQDVLGLGLSYGTSRELGARLSLYPNERLRIGYSYQFGTGSDRMSSKVNNTHEIGWGYRFGKEVTKKLL